MMAIDPGSTESGFVVYSTMIDEVTNYGKISNNDIIKKFKDVVKNEKIIVLIEKPDYISSGLKVNKFGKKVVQTAGSSVLEAAFQAGRFAEAFPGCITYGRQYLKNYFALKNDKEVRAFIKARYPHVKLTADSWQAFLLIHAYTQNVI